VIAIQGNIRNGVTCIIPALNEEETIAQVIRVVKSVKEIQEIIVVDDGSTDQTTTIARREGARVVRHQRNLGKGAAMKDGAAAARNAYLVFVDADLKNLSPSTIRRLIRPLLEGKADFIKGSYDYAMGRVSKLVVTPLLKIVYPFVNLKHPLSGEVALDKRKFHLENIEDGWGVDIQLVLQAARRKLRIKEVLLGRKEHKHQNLDALSRMSQQIIRTILSELELIAHHYRLVFFDLDKTLIATSSIEVLADAWGFSNEFKELSARVARGLIPDRVITQTLARHFAGRTQEEIDALCEQIPVSPFAKEVVAKLRKQRYRVRILSVAYSPVVQHFARKLDIHDFVCPRLQLGHDGRYTGELRPSRFVDRNGTCCGMEVCKRRAVDYVRKRFGFSRDECLCVGDGKSDRCMFQACGCSLGYQANIGDRQIGSLSEVLVHVE